MLVYGDTNTTLAGSLAAAKLGLKTAHIEAGLRSLNRSMPEELNRIVADHLSDLLFCPTEAAMNNLANEGLAERAYLVGDIMTDSLKLGLELANDNSDILKELTLNPGTFLLLTLHRPYNVDDPKLLSLILTGLNSLNKLIVFPVHPRTRNILCQIEPEKFNNIRFIEPLSYLDFLTLMQASEMIQRIPEEFRKKHILLGNFV